ncbi:MAG: energy transducer TonB [Cytophagales bacterium]|nr:MAG: energy transducer TonB [Cytophagales bacterium]TAF59788.1 MAG: energy transducer TonB [Cytophagales bacterium]
MSNKNFDKLSIDEIVFEGRNKTYGAYDLRIIYPNHINRALIIAAILFVLALVGPMIYSKVMPDGDEDEMQVVELVDLPPPPPTDPETPPPPDLPPPPPIVETIKFVPPEPKPDELVEEEEVPDQTELEDKQISTTTQEGDPNANPDEIIVDDGPREEQKVVEVQKEEEIFLVVEQVAEYPGGQKGYKKFLNKNLKYPKAASDAGVEGKVFLQFTVEKSGNIGDVKVVKSLGYGCDEEAIRVVKMMPPWTPAKQAGNVVRSKFTLTITFALSE